MTLGPRGVEYDRAHVITRPEYGGDLIGGVRVKIGDRKMTLAEGSTVTSDIPLLFVPIVGKPQGGLDGYYLVLILL